MTADLSSLPVYGYMPPEHVEAFKRAAHYFKVWILVRRGNPHAMRWIGQLGYVPKLGDCKAKTADRDFERRQCAGLVASPKLVPEAFSPKRLGEAREVWPQFENKLYVFDKEDPFNLSPDKAGKHYTLQLDQAHKHYGCVRYQPVQCSPEYIYSDYDLYAIVSAENPQLNQFIKGEGTGFGGADNNQGPNLYNVQYFLKAAGELRNAPDPRPPMVRHGEQETYKTDYSDPLDVFWPDGRTISTLDTDAAIKGFYVTVFEGRKQVSGNTVLREVYGKWLRT
jgi:hypothetical protein